MLADWVICAVLSLLLACATLFLLGHRVRRSHWSASLLTVALIASTAWLLQGAITGSSLDYEGTLLVALATGAVVTAAFERWNPLGHACFTATILAASLYLGYAAFVLAAAHLGPWSLAFGVILFVLQLTAMSLLVANTFEIVDVVCRTGWERQVDVKRVPGYQPMVSIHVPIHREPPELVAQTLDAIARLDYPDFEVLVIDNNTDDESLWRPVEAQCRRLGPRFRFFHLSPWPGYKSGALNYALEQTDPRAEIIGVVDADYIVEPNWLADLTGHFADPKVAFVQTPQDYRDCAVRGVYGRALALSYIYFFRISMASRNERNAIIFAGTMGLLRKDALEEVGGWDEWCITEDAEVSLRLLCAGYGSVYVDRTYGRGIMPLDYAGLKKQRFRWAFGGVQLLRMHARKLFNPLPGGKLTAAQRWSYVSGGLQWLNDPLALAFTMLLLIGAMTLLIGGTFTVQPFVGAVLFVPPVFLLFAVSRFLWALRVREHCSMAEAMRALAVLLGLTWVVTLACARGLVSRQGVFLRTPKQGVVADLGESLAIVRWEVFLGCACVAAAVTVAAQSPFDLLSARTLVIALLLWQAAIYLSALVTSLWDYRARRRHPLQWRRGFQSLGYAVGRSLSERRTAVWIAFGGVIFGELLHLAGERAPPLERIFRADPLNQFIAAPSVMSPTQAERAAAVLVAETDAARRGDVETALSLWVPDGVVVDENFTPTDAADDRVWRGREGVRDRYIREFRQRTYLSLQHLHPDVRVDADRATIVNDLDAVVQSGGSGRARRVVLTRSDRWYLRSVDGRWMIERLEVNCAPREVSLAKRERESE